ncbi:MAG: hypothetical protein K0Q87_1702 [Neobacillus sp.]|jgi:hypothetical protein|nr:hypothetical protein [Neobacillus sp.]
MRGIETRLKRLESRFNVKEEEEDLSLLSNDERHRRIAEIVYKDGSYNGYAFKSLEEYDSMTSSEQSKYIDEVSEVMKPWLEEKKKALNL